MEQVQLGGVEAPSCPDSIQAALKDFDSRLRCRFNTSQRVWEIQEWLERNQTWSHCFFWHDGPWYAMKYRPLPGTADALINKLCEIDIRRRGGDIKSWLREQRVSGSAKRAEKTEAHWKDLRTKLTAYVKWASKRMDTVMRRFQYGGESRRQAIDERVKALKDIGLR